MTIGSSGNCSISINGTAILPTHCTIYRSPENNVTILPTKDAHLIIDGVKVVGETALTQGAMITIGKSNYLRFNNPAEAKMIRNAMISRKSEHSSSSGNIICQMNSGHLIAKKKVEYHSSSESCDTLNNSKSEFNICDNDISDIDLKSLTYPKVFSSDHITVNMPAREVLGQKYANFAKNLADINRKEKTSNNTLCNNITFSENLPKKSNFIQNLNSKQANIDILGKINNLSSSKNIDNLTSILNNANIYNQNQLKSIRVHKDHSNYENAELSASEIPSKPHNAYELIKQTNNTLSASDVPMNQHLGDILEICTEYAEKQPPFICVNLTSSPIVQNRIKTNGSLPREKNTLPVYDANTSNKNHSLLSCQTIVSDTSKVNYQEIKNDQLTSPSSGEFNKNSIVPIKRSSKGIYENIFIEKNIPLSPRTKIRTTCVSPKKEFSLKRHGYLGQQESKLMQNLSLENKKTEYETLIKQFEEKIKLEIEAISSGVDSDINFKYPKEQFLSQKNGNKNNEILRHNHIAHQDQFKNISQTCDYKIGIVPSVMSETKMACNNESAVEVSSNNSKQLDHIRKKLLAHANHLKSEISEMQNQESEILGEMDLEKTLVKAELSTVSSNLEASKKQLKLLQNKIHRLDAQRNAARIIEEGQQAKLKQFIEIKMEQIKKLKKILKLKPNNTCLANELQKVCDSLENDRKAFEDLEFQYFEEESEWQAFREEIKIEEKVLIQRIEEKSLEMQNLEKQEVQNENCASSDANFIKNNMIHLIKELISCQERLLLVDLNVPRMIDQIHTNRINDKNHKICNERLPASCVSKQLQPHIMSRSMFGSTEVLFPKVANNDIMSKSVNENMFYNNLIEVPNSKKCISREPIISSSKQSNENKNPNINENIDYTSRNLSANSHREISEIISSDGMETEQDHQYILADNGFRDNMKQKKKEVESLEIDHGISMTSVQVPKHWQQMSNTQQLENNSVDTPYEVSKGQFNIKSNSEFEIDYALQKENNRTTGNSSIEWNEQKTSKLVNVFSSDLGCLSQIQHSVEKNLDENQENMRTNTIESIQESVASFNFIPKHQRPLTRYLPIFSPELNLRNHIISAGHQVSLCPHIFVDDHRCRGYLYKLGATFRGWSKRWFVLDRQCNALIYYSDKSERKPRGGAYFLS